MEPEGHVCWAALGHGEPAWHESGCHPPLGPGVLVGVLGSVNLLTWCLWEAGLGYHLCLPGEGKSGQTTEIAVL